MPTDPAKPASTASATPRWPLRAALVLSILAALAATPLLLLGLMPTLQELRFPLWRPNALSLAASFIDYAIVLWLIALLLAAPAFASALRRPARGRRWLSGIVALVAVAALFVQIGWISPRFTGEPATLERPITVLELNMLRGAADPHEIATLAEQADVVVLAELTPGAVEALDELGMRERFPHRVADGLPGSSGTGIYSRYPILQSRQVRLAFEQIFVTVDTPQLGPLIVAGVHPSNPARSQRRWSEESAALLEHVREIRAGSPGTPAIVAGDFNAVDRHLTMQRFYRDGFHNASADANRLWLPTWPASGPVPAVLQIDHVLLSEDLEASSVRSVTVSGTDHRGLIAQFGAAASP